MEARQRHPNLRRRRWFQGRPLRGADVADIAWFDPSGDEMTDEQWQDGLAKSLCVFLNGDGIPTPDRFGRRMVDDSLLIIFNAWHAPIDFVLPPDRFGAAWELMFDTAEPALEEGSVTVKAGDTHNAPGRSVNVFRRAG
jgi:isoamylase